ncbi:MAG: efflux RND transporter periplasmic adaptor subunit, partial [Pseudomonadota bacterium]
MRILPIITAILVVAFLYVLVFERDMVTGGGTEEVAAAPVEEATEGASDASPADDRISVVVIESVTRLIDSAVQLRGQTEASRQVEVRAETSGQVISEPLRRGAMVEAGQLICQIDEGTRNASLAEARARLAEAEAGVPTSEARVAEARASLDEAMINDNAASRLSREGFASETRVAQTKAMVEAARASVQAA